MAGVNKVILVGNLGKDPEVRAFENNKVANFPLATSENRRNKTTGERTTITEWHNLVVWGAQAEIAEKYLKKGNQVYVEGKLRTRSWDGNDGTKKYITEILVDNFTMLGAKPSSDAAASSATAPAKTQNTETAADDDLPF
ncbi:MAG: single-stranded DNA-binding protein [Flavobacteriales bacterium]